MMDCEKGNVLQLLPLRYGAHFFTVWIPAALYASLVDAVLQKGCYVCFEQGLENRWAYPLLLLEPCELHMSKPVIE